jgi:DNA polymerase-1
MDIQAGAHCVNSDLYKQADLDQLRRSFTSREDDWKDEFASKYSKKAMILVPKDALTDYACEDAVVTREAGLEIRRRIRKDPILENYFRRAVMPILTRTLFVMEENGFHVDTTALEETKKSFAKYTEEYHQKAVNLIPLAVRQEHAKKGLRLTRSAFLTAALYTKAGFYIEVPRKTKGGEPSADKTARALIRDDRTTPPRALEFLDEYDEWMMWHGLLTHSLPQLSEFTKSDGRIHGSFSIATAVTGRIASSKPNLMNIPKRSKAAPEVNRLITPQKKGWVLIEADLSQSEIRWLAHLSQDPELLRVYRAGEDIHKNTAQALVKQSWESLSKKEQSEARTKAKPANFGIIYGASARGFMRYCKVEYHTNIDIEESQRTIDRFYGLYPGIKAYHDKNIAQVRHSRILRSPLGRKWFIPAINSEDVYARGEAERFVMNYPIQEASSTTALLAAAEMNHKQVLPRDECFLALFVHDSLLFECLESKVEHYAGVIKHFMENPPLKRFGIKFSVPMIADVRCGKNRKDMEPVNA